MHDIDFSKSTNKERHVQLYLGFRKQKIWDRNKKLNRLGMEQAQQNHDLKELRKIEDRRWIEHS